MSKLGSTNEAGYPYRNAKFSRSSGSYFYGGNSNKGPIGGKLPFARLGITTHSQSVLLRLERHTAAKALSYKTVSVLRTINGPYPINQWKKTSTSSNQ